MIRNLAETQVKNTASDLINDAISKQIAQGTIQYDRIVYFEKDLDGRITAREESDTTEQLSTHRARSVFFGLIGRLYM